MRLISTSGSRWHSRVLYRKLPFNADRAMHQFYGIPTCPTHTLAEAARQWADDAPQWIAMATRLGITRD
jgi:hypothetical protein